MIRKFGSGKRYAVAFMFSLLGSICFLAFQNFGSLDSPLSDDIYQRLNQPEVESQVQSFSGGFLPCRESYTLDWCPGLSEAVPSSIKISLLSRGGITTGVRLAVSSNQQLPVCHPLLSGWVDASFCPQDGQPRATCNRASDGKSFVCDIRPNVLNTSNQFNFVDVSHLAGATANTWNFWFPTKTVTYNVITPVLLLYAESVDNEFEVSNPQVEVKINGKWMTAVEAQSTYVFPNILSDLSVRLGQFESHIDSAVLSANLDNYPRPTWQIASRSGPKTFSDKPHFYSLLAANLPGINSASAWSEKNFGGEVLSTGDEGNSDFFFVNGDVVNRMERSRFNSSWNSSEVGRTYSSYFSLSQPYIDSSGIVKVVTADEAFGGPTWRGYFTRIDGSLYTFTADSTNSVIQQVELIANNLNPISLNVTSVYSQVSSSPSPKISVMDLNGQISYIDAASYKTLRPSIRIDPLLFEAPHTKFYHDGSKWNPTVCSVNRNKTLYCAGVSSFSGWNYVNTQNPKEYVYSVGGVKLSFFTGAVKLGSNDCGTFQFLGHVVDCSGNNLFLLSYKTLNSSANLFSGLISTQGTEKVELVPDVNITLKSAQPTLVDGTPYPLIRYGVAVTSADVLSRLRPFSSGDSRIVWSSSGAATPKSTSKPSTPASSTCYLGGQTIPSGSAVVTYLAPNVPFGSTCSSQTRVCTNGALSGTYAYASCSVQGPVSCSFNGSNVSQGASVNAYQASSVAYGSSCVSEVRVCRNGNLSGSYGYNSCSVTAAPPSARGGGRRDER